MPLRSRNLARNLSEVVAHQRRQLWAQHDAEAVAFDVPAHDVPSIAPGVLAKRQDHGLAAAAAFARLFGRRAQNDAGGAIAEKRGGNEHRHARIVGPGTQATEIDGDEEDVPAGPPLSKPRSACKPRDAAAAAEPEDRKPLDVRGKIEAVHQK